MATLKGSVTAKSQWFRSRNHLISHSRRPTSRCRAVVCWEDEEAVRQGSSQRSTACPRYQRYQAANLVTFKACVLCGKSGVFRLGVACKLLGRALYRDLLSHRRQAVSGVCSRDCLLRVVKDVHAGLRRHKPPAGCPAFIARLPCQTLLAVACN